MAGEQGDDRAGSRRGAVGRDHGPGAGAGVGSSFLTPIWDLPEHGSRGPKPKRGRAEIAAAAVRIADAEGMDAVTMRRIAADLGLGTMSLYNYVPTKDHLLQLMVDAVGGEFVFPELPASDPRAAVVGLARQGRDIAQRHPWLAGVMLRPQAMGPNALRYVDCFLGLLAGSSLDTGAKMQVLAMVNGFAVMYGGLQAAVAAEQARTGVSAEQLAAAQVGALTRAVASGRYPWLAAAMASAAPPAPPEDIFEASVLRLIDGVLG